MEAAGAGSGSGLKKLPPPSQLFGIVSPPESDSQQVEAASPISSRPPASSYDELIRLSGEEPDRTGGGGNRWPRQETLALLKIRSEMDSAFRDATLKGPLWDEVSRKLAELGYKRNSKKCKEKFENVQKYYKRTKEGRGGRQDGKTYKFFTQLEALHNTAAAAATATQNAPPISVNFGVSNPTPISSVKVPPTAISPQPPMGGLIFSPADHFTVRPVAAPMGVSFSSNTSSASTEDDEDEEMGSGFDVAGTSRKRRRAAAGEEEEEKGSSGSTSHKMMMEFFEGLMKQVMNKQEAMQQKFLEAIEKREQDRMIREETWKNQEMGRLNREQERMAQERKISASRDAAIIAFLQKFTGQTIQLPAAAATATATAATVNNDNNVNISVPLSVPISAPAPAPAPVSVFVPSRPLSPVPPPQPLQPQTLPQNYQNPNPFHKISQGEGEDHIGGSNSEQPISSSRWPKTEVLALIKIRGGLESKYQETGPKGPLWEDISNAMQRMGYKRSSKRCKEKWENINKYFKKVKESNKKRREDSKTCPYFEELDALHRRKIVLGGGSDGASGGSGSRSSIGDTRKIDQDHPSTVIITPQAQTTTLAEGLSASLFGEGTDQEPSAAITKPEDIVNELMELQDHHLYRPGSNDNNVNQDDEEDEEVYCSDDDDDDDDGDGDDIAEEKRNNLDYKIEFQRRNVGNSNGVGSDQFQSMAVVQ